MDRFGAVWEQFRNENGKPWELAKLICSEKSI
jgi:hypothetical protein